MASMTSTLLTVPDVTPIDGRPPETAGGTIVSHVPASDVRAKHEGMVTFLGQLAPDVLIDEKALAKGFGFESVKTIQRWTVAGHLPPALPMPGNYRLVGSIMNWFRARAEMGDKKALEYRRHLAELKDE